MSGISVQVGGKQLLDNLSLTIRKGEKLLITGDSGSGKSTLLRALLFFIPFTGRLSCCGEVVGLEQLAAYRSRIAFLGQSIPPFSGTAEQVLLKPFGYRANRHRKPDLERARTLLKKLNLKEELLSSLFEELSVGEKQRLVLVQLLLLDREILVLDEPVSGLDSGNRNQVVQLLCGLKRKTVVVVSHDPEWPEAADRCLRVVSGRFRNRRR